MTCRSLSRSAIPAPRSAASFALCAPDRALSGVASSMRAMRAGSTPNSSSRFRRKSAIRRRASPGRPAATLTLARAISAQVLSKHPLPKAKMGIDQISHVGSTAPSTDRLDIISTDRPTRARPRRPRARRAEVSLAWFIVMLALTAFSVVPVVWPSRWPGRLWRSLPSSPSFLIGQTFSCPTSCSAATVPVAGRARVPRVFHVCFQPGHGRERKPRASARAAHGDPRGHRSRLHCVPLCPAGAGHRNACRGHKGMTSSYPSAEGLGQLDGRDALSRSHPRRLVAGTARPPHPISAGRLTSALDLL